MKEVTLSRAALKALSRMPAKTSAQIVAKIEQYAADPASLAGNVKILQSRSGARRLRVGDYRVIFNETGTVVAVVKIGPRGSIYE